MKDAELIAADLSPCVHIFIESLLNAESKTDTASGAGTAEDSVDIKEESRKAD